MRGKAAVSDLHVAAIRDQLADLVDCANSLTLTAAVAGQSDSKRCSVSGAGSLCYDKWCIKNNDCRDRRAQTKDRDMIQRPCNCEGNQSCTRCGGRGEIIDRSAGKNLKQDVDVTPSPKAYPPSGKKGHHSGGPKKK